MIVYRGKGDRISRIAYLPNETKPHPHSPVIAYVPDRRIAGAIALDLTTGEYTKCPPKTVWAHAAIDGERYTETLKMSKCKTIRVMSAADNAAWQALEDEYRALIQRRQDFLNAAFSRSRPLHQRDIDPNWK